MGCTQSTTAQEQAPLSQAPTSNAEQQNASAPEVESTEAVEEPEVNGELEVDDNGSLDIEEIGISGYKVSSTGIVMYSVFVKGSSGEAPHCVSKRYNDFKALHASLVSVMGDELPAMPSGGLMTFLKRKDENMMKERQQSFEKFLNACWHHEAAKENPAFKKFLE